MTAALHLAAATLVLAVLAAALAMYRTPVLALMMETAAFCQ